MSKLEKILVTCIVISLIIFGNIVLNPSLHEGVIPDPVQTILEKPETVYISVDEKNIPIVLLAEYTVEGVIKSKKKYTDYSSRVSQYDVALAWGNLNEKEIDSRIRYSQSGRWYYFNFDKNVSVSSSYIAEHSANVHLINQDLLILKKIENLNINDHIKLIGYLVSVNFDNGVWESSLARTDTGNGACEIMYVTDVEVLE
jgi:hypothetical protein